MQYTTQSITVTLCVLSVVSLAPRALAHAHLGVDTASGTDGDDILLKAGYLPSESDVSIDASRRLLNSGQPYTVTLDSVQSGGAYDGWYTTAGDLNPTSDFFAATGRLGTGWNGSSYANPGQFQYEIASVTPIAPTINPDERFVITWHEGGVNYLADSAAAAQIDRSVSAPPGTHRHGYDWYFDDLGSYDVTFNVWDASDQFVSGSASSATFRVNVVPEPGSLLLALPLAGLVAMRRRKRATC